MTNIADIAVANAISFEAKKDSLRQMQNGDWRVSFTVQGVDMDERITRAAMGTRFVAVLVEINDQELPTTPAEKEKSKQAVQTAKLQPEGPPTAGAKRTWEEFQPAQQAGIRCGDIKFAIFLEEEYPEDWREYGEIADCVRGICGVHSRSELGTNQKARVLWNQLDKHFQAWDAKIRLNA